ncbi:DUF4232 domain-containing protein [Streptomyces ziwulingensis]|uniref:DUF4232 domain-containing protein n=1 Tax=Streptomyces ziwulingensis TaxID=1045501 RepID=A0ABP9B1D2_9ACTN
MANTHPPATADTHRPGRRAALLAGAVLALGALTACGGDGGGGTASASAAPATAPPAASPTSSPPPTTGRDGTGGTDSPGASASATGGVPSDTAGSASASARTDGRCRTGELRAAVGRVDAGAGQRNFPVVLTNASRRTCTLYGYPGAAFTDASGRQLGPDPERDAASPETVTLAPGRSAWAALSFTSPEISGADTATPAFLLVTPPDEREPLRVAWQAGAVPVGGTESEVSLTVLSPGTGP